MGFLKGKPRKISVYSRSYIHSVKVKGKQASRDTVKVDRFTFNVCDYNLKGFILDLYDEKNLTKSQKLKFKMTCAKDKHVMEVRAEAIVTNTANGAVAASFTVKPHVS